MKYQLPAMISGIGSQGDQGQSRIQVNEHRADARQLQRLQKHAAGDVIDQRVQRFRVVGHLAHEHPHLVPVVEAHGEFVELARPTRCGGWPSCSCPPNWKRGLSKCRPGLPPGAPAAGPPRLPRGAAAIRPGDCPRLPVSRRGPRGGPATWAEPPRSPPRPATRPARQPRCPERDAAGREAGPWSASGEKAPAFAGCRKTAKAAPALAAPPARRVPPIHAHDGSAQLSQSTESVH